MSRHLQTLFLLAVLSFLFVIPTQAQVTTASMSGTVMFQDEPVIGATVLAVHEPSGTNYGTITNVDGRFSLQGMRTGGPYKVTISYVGYQSAVYSGITLQLGENYNLNVKLKESSETLDEIVITAAKTKFNTEKTGATTNISSSQITSLPTINRSISDIARLSPYASDMSFAGGDGRSTNFTVDGANFNNNFGLSDNLPGGGNPISMDAIEEVQVVIAPFDVRQTNFIGGGINLSQNPVQTHSKVPLTLTSRTRICEETQSMEKTWAHVLRNPKRFTELRSAVRSSRINNSSSPM